MQNYNLEGLLSDIKSVHKPENKVDLNKSIRFSLPILQNMLKLSELETEIFTTIANTPKLSAQKREIDKKDYEGLSALETLQRQLGGDYPWTNFYSAMPAGMTPRPSQERLAAAMPEILRDAQPGEELGIEKVVGSGKTALFLTIANLLPDDKQICIIAPTITLAKQIIHDLADYYPDQNDITFQFSHGGDTYMEKYQKGTHGRIVVFVDKSFTKHDLDGMNIHAIIMDEVHKLRNKQFREKLDNVVDSGLPENLSSLILAFTATFYPVQLEKPETGGIPFISASGTNIHWLRDDKVPPGKLVFRDEISELLVDKEIVPIKWTSVRANINFDSDDFNSETQEIKADSDSALRASWENIYSAYIKRYLSDPEMQVRKALFVACPKNIVMANEAAEAFNKATKEDTLCITSGGCYLYSNGKKSRLAHDTAVNKFLSGEIKNVFQISQLILGFNHPKIDLIFVMTPLKITDYRQLVGRGTRRTNDDKENVMVVDLVPEIGSNINPTTAFDALGVVKPQNSDEYVDIDFAVSDEKERQKRERNSDIVLKITNQEDNFYKMFATPEQILEYITLQSKEKKELNRFEITLKDVIRACMVCAMKMNETGVPWESIMIVPNNFPDQISKIWKLDNSHLKLIKFNPRIVYFDIISYLQNEFNSQKLRELQEKRKKQLDTTEARDKTRQINNLISTFTPTANTLIENDADFTERSQEAQAAFIKYLSQFLYNRSTTEINGYTSDSASLNRAIFLLKGQFKRAFIKKESKVKETKPESSVETDLSEYQMMIRNLQTDIPELFTPWEERIYPLLVTAINKEIVDKSKDILLLDYILDFYSFAGVNMLGGGIRSVNIRIESTNSNQKPEVMSRIHSYGHLHTNEIQSNLKQYSEKPELYIDELKLWMDKKYQLFKGLGIKQFIKNFKTTDYYRDTFSQRITSSLEKVRELNIGFSYDPDNLAPYTREVGNLYEPGMSGFVFLFKSAYSSKRIQTDSYYNKFETNLICEKSSKFILSNYNSDEFYPVSNSLQTFVNENLVNNDKLWIPALMLYHPQLKETLELAYDNFERENKTKSKFFSELVQYLKQSLNSYTSGQGKIILTHETILDYTRNSILNFSKKPYFDISHEFLTPELEKLLSEFFARNNLSIESIKSFEATLRGTITNLVQRLGNNINDITHEEINELGTQSLNKMFLNWEIKKLTDDIIEQIGSQYNFDYKSEDFSLRSLYAYNIKMIGGLLQQDQPYQEWSNYDQAKKFNLISEFFEKYMIGHHRVTHKDKPILETTQNNTPQEQHSGGIDNKVKQVLDLIEESDIVNSLGIENLTQILSANILSVTPASAESISTEIQQEYEYIRSKNKQSTTALKHELSEMGYDLSLKKILKILEGLASSDKKTYPGDYKSSSTYFGEIYNDSLINQAKDYVMRNYMAMNPGFVSIKLFKSKFKLNESPEIISTTIQRLKPDMIKSEDGKLFFNYSISNDEVSSLFSVAENKIYTFVQATEELLRKYQNPNKQIIETVLNQTTKNKKSNITNQQIQEAMSKLDKLLVRSD